MPDTIQNRVKHAWNAFMNRDPPEPNQYSTGWYGGYRPDKNRFSTSNERSIITTVYNRIAMDCAACDIKHVRLDDSNRYIADMDTYLNGCLTLSANKDQTGRAFLQDLVMSMFEEGVIAAAPIDTTTNPEDGSFDIKSLRVAKIVEWRPDYVKLDAYNDRTGNRQEIWMAKENVAIFENPFYSVMNEPNSVVQRLIHKLNMLDLIDEQLGAGKLDLIVQLPYAIKTTARKEQAQERRKDIEEQLTNTKYGIAYIDSTEHITQLNRPIENNLMGQIEYLQKLAYSQIGITQSILEGTANEQEQLNYNNRTIEPILATIVLEMRRKFLTKTARTQNQSIIYYRDPFKLIPVSEIAKIADTFTRNEIMTSNEIRQVVGLNPVDDTAADELRNKNLYATGEGDYAPEEGYVETEESLPQ